MSKVSFEDTVRECLGNMELLKNYDRLNNTSLSNKQPIEIMIDKVTGKREEELLGFISFVDEFIWTPLIEDQNKRQEGENNESY